jgi:hypothetical protein
MGRKPIQIVAETTTDGPAVITPGPVALIGRSVDIKQGYKSSSVLFSEVVTPGKPLQEESLFEFVEAFSGAEISPPTNPCPVFHIGAPGGMGIDTNDEGDYYDQTADDAVRESMEVA